MGMGNDPHPHSGEMEVEMDMTSLIGKTYRYDGIERVVIAETSLEPLGNLVESVPVHDRTEDPEYADAAAVAQAIFQDVDLNTIVG